VLAPSLREPAPVGRPARRIAAASGLALAVVLACVAISIPVLVSHLVTEGTDELATDPARSLERARQALAVDDDALPAYYLESAALARQGSYEPARAALLEATRREPHAFVPWALLGDLAVRAGKLEEAQRLYRRASRLNPRDPGLSELASSPEAVRRLAASGTG
jgi:tetratricopeptide (TPR) repeat protein